MSSLIDRLLSHASANVITLLALLMAVAIGLLDHLSGFELSFQIFYLLPVVMTAWYANRRRGLAMAMVAAFVWFIADGSAGRFYSEEWIGYWNALARLLLFALIAWLTDAAHQRLRGEQALSDFDVVTRLPNRRAFIEQLALEIARLRRYRDPFTIVYLHFGGLRKMVNAMGRELGDELLTKTSRRLRETTRESDHLARYDETGLIALLPKADWGEAEPLLRRLSESLEEAIDEGDWPVTPHIGALSFGHSAGTRGEMNQAVDRLIEEVRQNKEARLTHKRWHGGEARRHADRRRDGD